MVKILILVSFMMVQGCAMFTEYIEVPVPVREPCLDSLPKQPKYPLASLSRSITAKALEPGNEWMVLDRALATLHMQRAYIKAVEKTVAPCLR